MRTRRAYNAEINVVPYIDVMLVLLIIFMITAPMVNTSEIKLPEAGQLTPQDQVPIQITIKKNGNLQWSQAGQSAQSVKNANALIRALEEVDNEHTHAIVIAADRGTDYGVVVELLDLLQRQGFKKVGLLTQVPS